MTDQPGPILGVRHAELPDGRVIVTEYADAPSAVPDPYVRNRIAPQGDATGSEVITEFAPAPERPVSYPAALPFIPERGVWTTDSPTGTTPIGARWPCADPGALLAQVVGASVADGWKVIPSPPRAQLLGEPDVVLRRGSSLRELQIVPINDRALLQLWDIPDSLFPSTKT
jgi:hypothetical protein